MSRRPCVIPSIESVVSLEQMLPQGGERTELVAIFVYTNKAMCLRKTRLYLPVTCRRCRTTSWHRWMFGAWMDVRGRDGCSGHDVDVPNKYLSILFVGFHAHLQHNCPEYSLHMPPPPHPRLLQATVTTRALVSGP